MGKGFHPRLPFVDGRLKNASDSLSLSLVSERLARLVNEIFER